MSDLGPGLGAELLWQPNLPYTDIAVWAGRSCVDMLPNSIVARSLPMPASARHGRTHLSAVPSLTRRQVEELDDFLTLEGAAGGLPSASALHGFLTAIALVPAALPCNCWLPYVWGDGPNAPAAFSSAAQARRLRASVLRMYDDIVAILGDPDRTYVPLVLARCPGGSPALESEDWCRGFLRGMALGLPHWRTFLATPTGHRLLLPIVLLGAESIPSKWRRVLGNERERTALAACLPAVVEAVATQLLLVKFTAATQTPPAVPAPPEANGSDPCTCGSGKLRVACCGTSPTLH